MLTISLCWVKANLVQMVVGILTIIGSFSHIHHCCTKKEMRTLILPLPSLSSDFFYRKLNSLLLEAKRNDRATNETREEESHTSLS